MLEKIRDEFEDMQEGISTCMGKLDDLIADYEETHCNSIKDVDNFIWELKNHDLYDEKMKNFIDEYMKWGNK